MFKKNLILDFCCLGKEASYKGPLALIYSREKAAVSRRFSTVSFPDAVAGVSSVFYF